MFQSMLFNNESDLYFAQSYNDIDLEYEKSQLFLRKQEKEELSLEDYEILKNNLLFSNWSLNILKYFIDDNRILLKKYKYKDIIAKDKDSDENIYVLKSGLANCYIKINRSQIKNHQKILESNSTSPYFVESSIDRQKNKYLRETLVSSLSNQSELKSKYLDCFTRERTFHSLSLKNNDIPKSTKPKKKVQLNHFETKNTQLNKSILKNKPPSNINIADLKQMNTTFMVKPMSAIPDNKKINSLNDSFLFRSSSTNITRMNRTIKFFLNKKIESHNLNHPIEIVSSHNLSQLDLKLPLVEKKSENFCEEFNACNKIKTKNPEIWSEIYHFNQTDSCFINLLVLLPGQIFGLSDYLFDERRERDKFNLANSGFYEGSNDYDETSETNKYHLIVDSKYAECYVIDKELYLKYMLSFTTDKTIINKYLDQMRDICIKLPSVKTVNENFFQDLTWKLYKKRAYDQLVNLNMRKSCK
ncbi:unnamed protein product [Brachionus calyciflorus]|uniref:Cyclic nucleotide-binding domain-containing protein n=1 Tax=Brachionus calyciflorus TaxID=104777 RepID=A0A813VLA0_9BILA|nr:unnamed protein product [Brachionus calyciflorus]